MARESEKWEYKTLRRWESKIRMGVSGAPREEHSIEAFQKTLDDCQLRDVGYSRTWFTWERENLLETSIRERLDRGAANDDWLKWEKMIKVNRNELKCAFSKKLEDLMAEGRDDDNLAALIDVKIQLNFEIDKDETFWEQKAIANWLHL
ncbi:hypothetical protein Gogos_009336, partial [Gossypium gossypioides]|nr:hypothetical protein [Gossypium gossypioides]